MAVETTGALRTLLARARERIEEDPAAAVRELQEFFQLLVWQDPRDPEIQAIAEVGRELVRATRRRMAEAGLRGSEAWEALGQTEAPALVGLTETGIELWRGIQAIFQEHAVAAGEIDGEPAYISSSDNFEAIRRRWKTFWRDVTGMSFVPLYVEILGELTDRARNPESIARRVVKKGGARTPSEVMRAAERLLQKDVLTQDPERIFIFAA